MTRGPGRPPQAASAIAPCPRGHIHTGVGPLSSGSLRTSGASSQRSQVIGELVVFASICGR